MGPLPPSNHKARANTFWTWSPKSISTCKICYKQKLPTASKSSKIVAMTRSQSRAMANQPPTVKELQALITHLQAQVTALQNAAPAAQAAPGSPSCCRYSSSLHRFAPDAGRQWPNWLLDKERSVSWSTKTSAKHSTTRHLPANLTWPRTRLRLCWGPSAQGRLDGLVQGNQANHDLHQSWGKIHWHHQELRPDSWHGHAQNCVQVVLQGGGDCRRNSSQAKQHSDE